VRLQQEQKMSALKSRSARHARILLLMMPLLAADGGPASAQTTPPGELEANIARLIAVYPTFLERVDGNVLIWKDGTRMTIDDGRGAKDHETLLATADIKDMFFASYPRGRASEPPTPNADPGRARNLAFFNKMYGDCQAGGVASALVDVVWLPKKWGKFVKATRINGVASKLADVSAELDALPSKFDEFLFPPAGAYVCRPIAGTQRSSAHGHGIAIDISTKHAHYWRWSAVGAEGATRYRNSIPIEIVEIFERHGFIWGGKWYHYDTMHFEYRPELIR
jgi:hypothetical protein